MAGPKIKKENHRERTEKTGDHRDFNIKKLCGLGDSPHCSVVFFLTFSFGHGQGCPLPNCGFSGII
jgi:hypothetical protein